MEANEAPEKLYLHPTAKGKVGASWLTFPLTNEDIEYVRKDAFIEKALKFLDGCIPDYIELKHANVDTFMDVDNKRFIKDFINHINCLENLV